MVRDSGLSEGRGKQTVLLVGTMSAKVESNTGESSSPSQGFKEDSVSLPRSGGLKWFIAGILCNPTKAGPWNRRGRPRQGFFRTQREELELV